MKRCFIITFDLKNPGLNQGKLVTAIQSSKTWARLGDNSFIILSDKNSSQIRDVLLDSLYQGDKIYVGLLNNSAAWYGLGEEVATWIRNNLK
jgi:hypothetical protein